MKSFETVMGRKCTKSAIILWYNHAIPHMKALICGYLEPEKQGHGSTLSIGHVLLKIKVLCGKSRFSDLFFPPLTVTRDFWFYFEKY